MGKACIGQAAIVVQHAPELVDLAADAVDLRPLLDI